MSSQTHSIPAEDSNNQIAPIQVDKQCPQKVVCRMHVWCLCLREYVLITPLGHIFEGNFDVLGSQEFKKMHRQFNQARHFETTGDKLWPQHFWEVCRQTKGFVAVPTKTRSTSVCKICDSRTCEQLPDQSRWWWSAITTTTIVATSWTYGPFVSRNIGNQTTTDKNWGFCVVRDKENATFRND